MNRRKAGGQNGGGKKDGRNGSESGAGGEKEYEGVGGATTSALASPNVGRQRQQSGKQQQQQQQQQQASGASTPDSYTSGDEADLPPKQLILERHRRPSMGGLGARKLSYSVRAPGTPFHELDLSEIPWFRHELADQETKKGLTNYRRLFFLAGIFAGGLLVWALSQHVVLETHLKSLRGVLDEQLSSMGIDLGSLDLSFSIPGEFADLGDKLFSSPRDWVASRDFVVGRMLAKQGVKVQHPVILLPGIVSTGLESWTTNEDTSSYFRKRLWGTTTMMRTIVLEKEMWIKHLSLDPVTGLDPPGIKVRAAEGLDAASYFVSGYWIWARIIENLAAIGYDTNDLWLAAYDWRLSYHNLEKRDRFFSRMKLRFEQNLLLTGKKSVLVSHSMGSSVALHFMKWVEAEGPTYGNGGPDWVERHIESFTSIAGTFLGVPKAMAALLSGEMRDTVELPPAGAFLLERFFSRKERAKLFRTWAGSASMLIKGGEAVWGNLTWAPDDEEDGLENSHGKLYSFKHPDPSVEGYTKGYHGDESPAGDREKDDRHGSSIQHSVPNNLSAVDGFTWLLQHTPSTFQQMVQQNYSNGMEFDEEQVKRNNQIEKTWANPLEAALPNAPSLKIHCIYGVGKPTERSYWYAQGPYERDEFVAEGDAATCLDCGDTTTATPLEFPTGRTGWIDTSIHDESALPVVRSGVKFADGDGTVSAHSLGAMCLEGWRQPRYNPGGVKVMTHEIAHDPQPMDLRGGSTTGDHVDILGSFLVNEIVLKVAAGLGSEVEESFFSKAKDFAKRVDWDGVHLRKS